MSNIDLKNLTKEHMTFLDNQMNIIADQAVDHFKIHELCAMPKNEIRNELLAILTYPRGMERYMTGLEGDLSCFLSWLEYKTTIYPNLGIDDTKSSDAELFDFICIKMCNALNAIK